MGRLLTVTKDSSLVEEYQYGPNGARISEINTLKGIITPKSYAYSDEDHLLTAGTTQYQYDADGFLVTKTKGTEITEYAYSSRGELLQVKLPDGKVIEYLHDPLGRRIAKMVNGVVTEKYLWQGLTQLLAVYDSSSNLLMRFNYADERMPVSMTAGGNTYYLTYDQVGSLRVVADSSGGIVKRIDYDTFGNVLNDTASTFEVPFGFAGGLTDKDTGLIRFGYRDYDPDIGRWTAKDPIRFWGGDTDLYGYVQNNPINLVDPWGLWEFTYSAGGHFPTGPWPIAAGGTASSSLVNPFSASGGLEYRGVTPEATAGVWGDIGVSAGIGDLSGTGNQAGPIIGIGAGRYGGLQIILRREFDPNKAWYDPLKYIDAVSVGLGLGLGLPVNVTTPLTKTDNKPCAN